MLMRILLIVLLLLNAAYLGWRLWHPAGAPAHRLPPPQPGVTQLVLLQERQPEPVPGSAAAQGEGAVEAKSPSTVAACYSLGPFRNRKEAQQVLGQLREAGLSARLRDLEEQAFVGYWVYLPPRKSRAEARRVARDLARRGIKDFYIVNEAENRNAISLGLFRDQFHANRRLAKLRAMGYQPRKRVRRRARTNWWVDYREEGDARLPQEALQALLAGNRRLTRVDRSCPAD
ncbi:MAG TPA: SPOR domain-containing protein [Chromatiales bacterium]|nr:SPOR domain-containing protein [Chromatiales bacterium]